MESREVTVVLIVVCAIAVVLTAATVASPIEGGTGAGGSDDGVGIDEGAGDPFGGGFGSGNGDAIFALNGICGDGGFPTEILAVLAFVVGVAALIGFQRDGILGAIATAVVALLPIGTFVLFLFATCVIETGEAASDTGFLGGQGSGGGSGLTGAATQLSAPQIAASLLLLLTVGGALVAVVVGRGDDEDEEEDDWTVPEQDVDHEVAYDLDRIGAAAGAAADRIDADADVSNEVFRAWREMTRHLRVDRPAASTPAEFADAAVDAGMDPDDVAELTDLFEAVRYGGQTATDERARRARAALRRIERTYGGETS